jgi:hypothetical protein
MLVACMRAASVNTDSGSGSSAPPPPPRVAPMYESSEMQTTDANGDRVTVPFVTLPLLGPSLSDVRHRGHALPATCTLVRAGGGSVRVGGCAFKLDPNTVPSFPFCLLVLEHFYLFLSPRFPQQHTHASSPLSLPVSPRPSFPLSSPPLRRWPLACSSRCVACTRPAICTSTKNHPIGCFRCRARARASPRPPNCSNSCAKRS